MNESQVGCCLADAIQIQTHATNRDLRRAVIGQVGGLFCVDAYRQAADIEGIEPNAFHLGIKHSGH